MASIFDLWPASMWPVQPFTPPIDPTRPCPFNAADQCGKSDFYNGPTVLPGMDDLDPHIPTEFVSKSYTWSVKLPAPFVVP